MLFCCVFQARGGGGGGGDQLCYISVYVRVYVSGRGIGAE